MCFAGLATTLGPNINAPMDPSDVEEAHRASRRALELSADGPPRERA